MSYIGRQLNNLSDRVKLDSLTASATATYNLLLNTVAYVPSSAESLTVSLNGVIQAPQSSYTVSGSQITFASALTSSDSIDFILAERSITLQTPSAGSVGTSQLAADAVNGDKIADDSISDEHLDITAITGQTEKTSLADADKFLISDSAASGALKYVQKSNLPSGGLVYVGGTSSTGEISSLTADSIFSSTYQNYMIVYGATVFSGSNNTKFQMRVRSGGSTQSGSAYHSIQGFIDTTTGAGSHNMSSTNSNNADRITLGADAMSNSNNLITCVGTLYCFDVFKTDEYKLFLNNTVNLSWSAYLQGSTASAGFYLSDTQVDGLTFFANNGNLKRGYFRAYGIVDS